MRGFEFQVVEDQRGVADTEVAAALAELEAAVLVERQLFEAHGDVGPDELEIFGLDGKVGELEEGVVDVGTAGRVVDDAFVVVDENKAAVGDVHAVGSKRERQFWRVGVKLLCPFGDVDGLLILVGAQHDIEIVEAHVTEA